MKTTRADYAATVPWRGITGKPAVFPYGPIDISQLTAAGFASGKVPVWNGSRFVPATLPIPTPPSPPPGNGILPLNSPGVATRRQPPGLPFGPTQDVWYQEIFDIRQYGAMGDGNNDDLGSVNRAIADINNQAGAGTLYVPAGNFVLSDSPDEITSPCSIIGEGWGVSKFTLTANGFLGGAGGAWLGVSGLSLLTDGTSGTAITLTDGTNGGDNFSFHDLNIDGFVTGISVAATARNGWVYGCRINPKSKGIDLACASSEIFDCVLSNQGTTAAIALSLSGDDHLIHGLRMFGSLAKWNNAIYVPTGTGIILADCLIDGTQNAMINLATTGKVRVQNISFANVLGNPPVVFDPLLHYVNELHGLGIGNTNTSYDLRKELAASGTWNPDSLRPLESTTLDITLTGARIGDQVAVGTPDGTDYWSVSGRVVSNDTVRITIQNLSLNTVDLASATYKVRIFN